MPELGSGRYVFADLDEVESIITELEAIRQDLVLDNRDLREAIGLATPPAEDGMSRGQARAYHDSLRKAYEHSQRMYTYVEEQTTKLSAARSAYAEADSTATSRLTGVDR